ncbi:hypothetical protein BOTBODRAFT_49690 [Botryobasidium botryosum FD-172 SS1]|uniref:Uncharacterized protein n=1 Tax=Botryobasidium botryosum (strain FD-172 SS1) TaxID=930990 RepID=A0A067M2M3_BOTB1|nr:hypothetical protein BOTBODRAFT_49690 [Botryobasidium botryosum FD-172 SS1]
MAVHRVCQKDGGCASNCTKFRESSNDRRICKTCRHRSRDHVAQPAATPTSGTQQSLKTVTEIWNSAKAQNARDSGKPKVALARIGAKAADSADKFKAAVEKRVAGETRPKNPLKTKGAKPVVSISRIIIVHDGPNFDGKYWSNLSTTQRKQTAIDISIAQRLISRAKCTADEVAVYLRYGLARTSNDEKLYVDPRWTEDEFAAILELAFPQAHLATEAQRSKLPMWRMLVPTGQRLLESTLPLTGANIVEYFGDRRLTRRDIFLVTRQAIKKETYQTWPKPAIPWVDCVKQSIGVGPEATTKSTTRAVRRRATELVDSESDGENFDLDASSDEEDEDNADDDDDSDGEGSDDSNGSSDSAEEDDEEVQRPPTPQSKCTLPTHVYLTLRAHRSCSSAAAYTGKGKGKAAASPPRPRRQSTSGSGAVKRKAAARPPPPATTPSPQPTKRRKELSPLIVISSDGDELPQSQPQPAARPRPKPRPRFSQPTTAATASSSTTSTPGASSSAASSAASSSAHLAAISSELPAATSSAHAPASSSIQEASYILTAMDYMDLTYDTSANYLGENPYARK